MHILEELDSGTGELAQNDPGSRRGARLEEPQDDRIRLFDRRTLYGSALLFAGSAVLLFLLNSRVVNVFDEGILLTGTMRTMAGQVLHRDFYYDYGPAQFYLFAGLFKLFGTSVLVERLAAVFSNAWLVVQRVRAGS